MPKRAPNSRPVHPCCLPAWTGRTGADFSTWANITGDGSLPNLVTAQGSTLTVYKIHEESGTLMEKLSFPNLAGNVCFLGALQVDNPTVEGSNDVRRQNYVSDSLLVGFSGHPRLSIVSIVPKVGEDITATSHVLSATSLLDLTSAVTEACVGATSPLEQDMMASMRQKKNDASVAVVLGGGVAVVCLTICYIKGSGWIVDDPYTLSLQNLSKILRIEQSLSQGQASSSTSSSSSSHPGGSAFSKGFTQGISTGFGDVIGSSYLQGYSEPTLVLLHSNPSTGGWICSGRLGRPNDVGGTRHGLYVTACSVTVTHRRAAVLWSVEVPADALLIKSVGSTGCIVVCANSIVAIDNAGQITQCLATNGWTKATLPTKLLERVRGNPWPFPKLSIQLDGAKLCAVTPRAFFVSLRSGHMYLLQCSGGLWSMLPLYQRIGGIGQVANVLCWSSDNARTASASPLLRSQFARNSSRYFATGIVFVGSRMGDSSLLRFAIEQCSTDTIKAHVKIESKSSPAVLEMGKDSGKGMEEMDADAILAMEEAALYSGRNDSDGPANTSLEGKEHNIVPTSDDEAQEAYEMAWKRMRSSELLVVQAMIPLDSLTSLGPIGPTCMGPIAKTRFPPKNDGSLPPLGSSAYVMPCGFSTSGALALITAPGRDDRLILSEEDCINYHGLFSLPNMNAVLMCSDLTSQKNKILSIASATNLQALNSGNQSLFEEIPMQDWFVEGDARALAVFNDCTILQAFEISANVSALIVTSAIEGRTVYMVVLLKKVDGDRITVSDLIQIPIPDTESISSISRLVSDTSQKTFFAFTLVSGNACLMCFDAQGSTSLSRLPVPPPEPKMEHTDMDVGDANDDVVTDDDDEDESKFYRNNTVVATDLFHAPTAFFAKQNRTSDSGNVTDTPTNGSGNNGNNDNNDNDDNDRGDDNDDAGGLSDDEMADLYKGSNGEADKADGKQARAATAADDIIVDLGRESMYLAVCRQSGLLEVYDAISLLRDENASPLWSCAGCGHGGAILQKIMDDEQLSPRKPRMNQVVAKEIKFFFSGPSNSFAMYQSLDVAPFCLAMETNAGDVFLYTSNFTNGSIVGLDRVTLGMISRSSQEQTRHRAKLRRKKIVNDDFLPNETFRRNRLHPFTNLSGQDGLFAAVTRPIWFLAERGQMKHLVHRSQHAAPAGGRQQSVTAFCSRISLPRRDGAESYGFMTLHERVGRVGSQRLTSFSGITVPDSHGVLMGGGYYVEKIPFGVTVRHIEFVKDRDVSTEDHPLYAVLVSRDIDGDQTELNDDGLTDEEREQILAEKESEKVKRQVEADMGGFDIEQEWVEEIEREDCFAIETELGGAPPIATSAYSLWIVDAANKWNVVDSYELGEYEHGLTMKVMSLSEFNTKPGSTEAETPADEDLTEKTFITVGTGTVDKNGEDVISKGRVLLFSLSALDKKSALGASQRVELSLTYEKDIFHGPVTTLSCLSTEGKHRLVIGAGADVNVEQWGNEKLLQVGFFRATMQVLDIKLMKNFLILSDAYDSLHFLVWRESDKSLTLLAKDYDPIPVHAAGLMSRGGSLVLVCHDDRQNLQFFQYAPGDAGARGGNKLVCRADFHLGTQTSSLDNHSCQSSLLINSATPSSALAALKQQDTFFGRSDDDQRLAIHFGTIDGGLSTVIPLSEPVYWRLTALQTVMVNAMEGGCALSQQAWRLYRRSFRRGGCRNNTRKKNVIDGDLVLSYADLAIADQEDLASAIGSTVQLILDNLLELKCASMLI